MKQNHSEIAKRISSLILRNSIIVFVVGIIIAGAILFLHQDGIGLPSTKPIKNVEKNITFIVEKAEPVFEKIENSISKL